MPHGDDTPILADEGGAVNCSGTRFLHGDHQGSIVAQANCSGNPTAINTYDEYGIPSSTNLGRFQYTGQAWIPELGMYHYKARIYSPTLGRFLQTDPIGYEDQVNLYAYVANDPVNMRDPTGQNKVKWFVETVKGGWKRVTEKQAISSRQAGKNVSNKGPGQVSRGKRLEEKVQGSKGAVKKDAPHANGNPEHRGTNETHFQPTDRRSGGDGHTFVGPPAAGVTVGVGLAGAMRDVANEIGTATDKLTPSSSNLERKAAAVWDFFDPASIIAETLRVGADLIDPKE
jgi:RHS repeat-associated protein